MLSGPASEQHAANIATSFAFPTRGRGFYEFTMKWRLDFQSLVLSRVADTARAPHFGIVANQENADPDVRRDFEKFFARLVPDGDPLFVLPPKGKTICRRTFAPSDYSQSFDPHQPRQLTLARGRHLSLWSIAPLRISGSGYCAFYRRNGIGFRSYGMKANQRR